MTARIVSSILMVTLLGGCSAGREAALPYYGTPDLTPAWTPVDHEVGRFSLRTQTGALVTDDSLRGRIHVASFIYTRCSVMCPVIVGSLARVQDNLGDASDVMLVSYTVTPELDTPEALAAFGRERAIDPARWLLVTGDRGQIYHLAREGYFANDERDLGEAGPESAFLHTEKLLLVDQDLRLRGVYNASSGFDVVKLLEDIALLRNGA